jgi:DNA-binding winged helix-turn-helix (wHTH) protein
MDLPLSRRLTINDVIADFGSETLHTSSGDSVELRPQAFAVFRYLVDNAGRLVTKNELMQAVWSGTAVTDDSLVQCIHEIRRALQDDERAVVKTAPKRGYRLVLPPEAGSGDAESRPGNNPDRAGYGREDPLSNALRAPENGLTSGERFRSPSSHSSTCRQTASRSISPTA